jgi:hypothetical protein
MIRFSLWLWYFMLAYFQMPINSVSAQSGDLDSFLSTLRNKDLRFKTVVLSPSPPAYDSVRHVFNVSQLQLRITSINVGALKAKYATPTLIRRLVSLLDDSTRDWYANLLLYQLSGLPNLGALGIQSRDIWLSPVQKDSPTTYRDRDIAMWRKYELELSNPSNK